MNILSLEDNNDDATLICDVLRQEVPACCMTRVDTRSAFAEALDRGGWDIILSDYSLPFFDGISALDMAAEKLPNIPFIFVTGALGEERAVETLRRGATDFVLKHRLSSLPKVVIRAQRESESAQLRRQAEQKLKTSLREKDLLLQEVHHRVKNNLQVISSLLNMQAVAAENPELTSALQESRERIIAMAIIHEMLYSSDSLHSIDFAKYVQLLSDEVSNSYGRNPALIRFEFDLQPVHLEIDCAIPCGLILNELLSNALKYAFPGGRQGDVRISLREWNGIRLAVEDNGIGLSEDRAVRERKSLGLNIVQILTQQLRGTMAITSHKGTQFVLTFPITNDHSVGEERKVSALTR